MNKWSGFTAASKAYIRNNKSLITSSGWIISASVLTSGANFITNMLFARGLNPQDYGTLKTLIAVFLIFSLPLGSLGSVTTKYVADFVARSRTEQAAKLAVDAIRGCLVIGGLVLVALLFVQPIQDAIKIGDLFLLTVIGINIIIAGVLEVLRGSQRGLELFGWLGLSISTEGVVKLLCVVAISLIGWGLRQSVLALSFALIASVIVTALPLEPRLFSTDRKRPDYKPIALYAIPTLGLAVHTALTINIDILAVNHFFPSYDVGIYGVSITLANLLLLPAGAISMIVFPRIAVAKAQGKNTLPILLPYLGINAIINLVLCLVMWVAGPWLVNTLFGSEYLPASTLLIPLVFAKSFEGMISILLSFEMAMEKFSFFALLLVSDLLKLILLSQLHMTTVQIAVVVVVSNLLMFTMIAGMILLRRQPSGKEDTAARK
jgi:O-antigen/teichoic acid export membrane protein